VPHLGNYLGALRQWAEIQRSSPESAALTFCIVDLHAITQTQRVSELRQRKRELLATLLAVGLDPRRCTIFEQSKVPAHSELMWILSCVASMGRLSRMTQWKVW
jgi:tryptophanyl-tRNA synthetase